MTINRSRRLIISIFIFAVPIMSNAQSKAPTQLLMKITRYMLEDSLVTDSISYQYDASGRLTNIIDLNTGSARQSFLYSDTGISSIKAFDKKRKLLSDFKDRVSASNNGDRILLLLDSKKDSGTDTARLIYQFKKGVVQERTILVNSGVFSSRMSNLSRYNSDGNLMEVDQVIGQDTIAVAKVLAWDQQQNPFHGLSKFNFIFMQNDFPFNSQSLHNPTKFIDYKGDTVEIEMTYSSDGYPLTYKRKGENFIADEFIYNK